MRRRVKVAYQKDYYEEGGIRREEEGLSLPFYVECDNVKSMTEEAVRDRKYSN